MSLQLQLIGPFRQYLLSHCLQNNLNNTLNAIVYVPLWRTYVDKTGKGLVNVTSRIREYKFLNENVSEHSVNQARFDIMSDILDNLLAKPNSGDICSVHIPAMEMWVGSR